MLDRTDIVIQVQQAITDIESDEPRSFQTAIDNIWRQGAIGLVPAFQGLASPSEVSYAPHSKTIDIRKHICPALKTVSNDVFEIARVVAPILVSLQAAGTISIPLSASLMASICIVIARMGIASLCADGEDGDAKPGSKPSKGRIVDTKGKRKR